MVSKNNRSTSRLSRWAAAKNTASCTRAWVSASTSKSIARYAWSSSIPARPGIAASWLTHSAADSLLIGSVARLQTKANNTRSTSVPNRRVPSSLASASATPSRCHKASSSQTAPSMREDSTRRAWSPASGPAGSAPWPSR